MTQPDIEIPKELTDLLKSFTTDQLRFVASRMYSDSDKEAAEKIGMNVNSIYQWTNKQEVNKAVRLAQLDGVLVGWERMRRMIGDALDILEDGLKKKEGDEESHQWEAMKEVLDRMGMMMPARHAVDMTSAGNQIVFGVKGIDLDNDV